MISYYIKKNVLLVLQKGHFIEVQVKDTITASSMQFNAIKSALNDNSTAMQ